jgi:hypothetical protein
MMRLQSGDMEEGGSSGGIEQLCEEWNGRKITFGVKEGYKNLNQNAIIHKLVILFTSTDFQNEYKAMLVFL